MAEISDSYRTKVGREQGGDRFYMKADGEFKFYDTDVTGLEMKNFFKSFFTVTNLGLSNVSLISGPITLSRYYGTYFFSLPTACSLASCNLPSALKGARLVIDCMSVIGDGNLICDASGAAGGVTGAGLLGTNSTILSSISISAIGYAVLVCAVEGTWQITEKNNSVTEQPVV